jgi:hypothetical protein
LPLKDVAVQLDCSPAWIERMETGEGPSRPRDVRDLLDVYGIEEEQERERLLGWARIGQAKAWWSDYSDILRGAAASYIEYEWDAVRVNAYEPHIINGLLQTQEYARAILERSAGGHRSSEDMERLVEVRLRRQESLRPEHGLTILCILDESALRRVPSSTEVLLRQLEHLQDVSQAPQVDLRIVPFSASFVSSGMSSFAQLSFADTLESGLVYLEESNELVAEPEVVTTYSEQIHRLTKIALSEDDSRTLIKEVASVMRSRNGPSAS